LSFVPVAGHHEVVELFIQFYGPVNRTYAALSDPGRHGLHADFTSLWTRNNRGINGTTRVMAEYLEIVAVVPSALRDVNIQPM